MSRFISQANLALFQIRGLFSSFCPPARDGNKPLTVFQETGKQGRRVTLLLHLFPQFRPLFPPFLTLEKLACLSVRVDQKHTLPLTPAIANTRKGFHPFAENRIIASQANPPRLGVGFSGAGKPRHLNREKIVDETRLVLLHPAKAAFTVLAALDVHDVFLIERRDPV